MCFITVRHGVGKNEVITETNATVTVIVFFQGNVTTVITALKITKLPREALEKTNTEYTGSLGYNSVFRVCYITSIGVDVILDTCSTIRNNYMLS